MSRVAGNWLLSYQEYCQDQEAPDTYHLWTGLSILASTVRRNVWLSQGYYIVYPNLYVILVGPAGKLGKSTVIRMGRKLLREVPDIRWSADSITREELIRFMERSKVGTQCAVTIHSTELSSLIDPSGIKMIQFMTDIYDCDDVWEYGTKTSGRDKLDNPCLNMLAGTTASWMADGFPVSAIEHGFISRTVFLYEDTPRFLIPRPRLPNPELTQSLVDDLEQIAMIEGEFDWLPDGQTAYDKFYETIYSSMPGDYRIAGFHWRKRVLVLKVAMLLSIAENDSLEISEWEIETAGKIILEAEKNMPRAFSAIGKYDYSSDLERILTYIVVQGSVSIAEIHRQNYAVGGDEVKKILTTLSQMGAIQTSRDSEGQFIAQATPVAAKVVQVAAQSPVVKMSGQAD